MGNKLVSFNRCIAWIKNNVIGDDGIGFSTNDKEISVLVTKSYISTLYDWGERKLADGFKNYIDNLGEDCKTEKEEIDIDEILKCNCSMNVYADIAERLYDEGKTDLCFSMMEKTKKFQNKNGGISEYKGVKWTCPGSMFHLAVVWYKLGKLEEGNRIFYYALDLQNNSGGWYGSYSSKMMFPFLFKKSNTPEYYPDVELSIVNKYFMDALTLKEKLEFEKQAPIFMDEIAENDGRYILVKELLEKQSKSLQESKLKVCDVGCGKGRYLKRLVVDLPENEYYASDISENVSRGINGITDLRISGMTNIPYEADTFDFVYVCEAFEHAINISAAFSELYRILKKEGKLIIIDKPVEKLGQLQIYEWEQWIDDNDIAEFTNNCGGELEIVESVPYNGNKNDGLFRAWIVTKK